MEEERHYWTFWKASRNITSHLPCLCHEILRRHFSQEAHSRSLNATKRKATCEHMFTQPRCDKRWWRNKPHSFLSRSPVWTKDSRSNGTTAATSPTTWMVPLHLSAARSSSSVQLWWWFRLLLTFWPIRGELATGTNVGQICGCVTYTALNMFTNSLGFGWRMMRNVFPTLAWNAVQKKKKKIAHTTRNSLYCWNW